MHADVTQFNALSWFPSAYHECIGGDPDDDAQYLIKRVSTNGLTPKILLTCFSTFHFLRVNIKYLPRAANVSSCRHRRCAYISLIADNLHFEATSASRNHRYRTMIYGLETGTFCPMTYRSETAVVCPELFDSEK